MNQSLQVSDKISGIKSASKIIVMPSPKREFSWRDQLRNERSNSKRSVREFSCDCKSQIVMSQDVSEFSTADVFDRLYKENEFLRRKRDQQQQDRAKQLQEEDKLILTFSPQGLKHHENSKLRNVAQFLADQEQLKQNQIEKVERERQKYTQPYKIVPARPINKDQHEQTKIKVQQKFEEKRKKLIEEQQATFKPSISKKSLQLASERPNQILSPLNRSLKQKDSSNKVQVPMQNRKSQELVVKKFKQEFKQVITNTGFQKQLTQIQAIQVLNELGFFQNSQHKDGSNYQIAVKLVNLGLDENNLIESQVLLELLCELQSYNLPNTYIKRIPALKFTLFYPLILSRKEHQRKLKMLKDTEEYRTQLQNNLTLSPKTNQLQNSKILKSSTLACNKLRLSDDNILKITNLARPKICKNAHFNKMQLDDLLMIDCTFTPKINDKFKLDLNPRVYQEFSMKQQKSRIDLDYEAQKTECTFKPMIRRKKFTLNFLAPSRGDIIQPGQQARREQPSQNKSCQISETLNKIVQLDVRISDTESRLLIVKDEKTFTKTVRQFCLAGGLDQQQQQALTCVISQNTGWQIEQ